MEYWKEIDTRPDMMISSTGIVKNNKGRLYKPTIKNGYLRLSILNNRSIHRLVAEHFIDNPNNYEVVNHINEDKLDNRIENLEWTTQKDNIRKFLKNNDKVLKIRKVKMYSLNGEYMKTFVNILEASKETGINRHSIGKCCNKRHKTACGYIFKLQEDEDHSVKEETEFKPIEGYENYTISSCGKVYNTNTRRYLKPCMIATGNYYVSLVRDKKKKNFYIHRLVAKQFLTVPENFDKCQVIHINGVKSDNMYSNLKII